MHRLNFVLQILRESEGFDEARVIFERYDTSIKSRTRDSRTKGVQVQYKVDDDTVIARLARNFRIFFIYCYICIVAVVVVIVVYRI